MAETPASLGRRPIDEPSGGAQACIENGRVLLSPRPRHVRPLPRFYLAGRRHSACGLSGSHPAEKSPKAIRGRQKGGNRQHPSVFKRAYRQQLPVYGDWGTEILYGQGGLNEYAPPGLRMVEMPKDRLGIFQNWWSRSPLFRCASSFLSTTFLLLSRMIPTRR